MSIESQKSALAEFSQRSCAVLESLRESLELLHAQGVSVLALSRAKLGGASLGESAMLSPKGQEVFARLSQGEPEKAWAKALGLAGYCVEKKLGELAVSVGQSDARKARLVAKQRLEPALIKLRAIRRDLRSKHPDLDWDGDSAWCRQFASELALACQQANDLVQALCPQRSSKHRLGRR